MNDMQCGDRITNLPNSLITKILSCLPTKQAVATCILSSKWKPSWTSITNLDFDDYDGKDHSYFSYISTFRKFTSFVTRVLLLHDGSFLQSLYINCLQSCDESFVYDWLVAAVRCNIQELDLTIPIKSPGQMPADIFLCRTLVVLKLDGRQSYGINMPNSSHLPGLRTLHLTGIELSDDVSINNLLSGCPMLEELKLCQCVGIDVRVFKITAPFLKILIVHKLSFVAHFEFQIVIDTPALEYFDFRDFIPEGFIINNMNHLIEATISLRNSYYDDGENCVAVTDLLSRISHVQTLILSEFSMLVLGGKCQHPFPKFGRLTYLEIHAPGNPLWRLLTEVLENSPYLENLKILKGAGYMMKESLDTLPFYVPSCFLSHLKKIKIELFDDDDMKLFEYILGKAQVLEEFALCYDTDFVEQVDAKFFEKLQSLPRASPICKVMKC